MQFQSIKIKAPNETITAIMYNLVCHTIPKQSTVNLATDINHSNTYYNHSTMDPVPEQADISYQASKGLKRKNNKTNKQKEINLLYSNHLVELPNTLLAFNEKYNYPFRPSDRIFMDRLPCHTPTSGSKDAVLEVRKKARIQLKQAKILEWKPTDLVQYYDELSEAQKDFFDCFAYPEKSKEALSKYDIALACCLTQWFINLIYKPGLGKVQFWNDLDKSQTILPEEQRFLMESLPRRTYHQVKYIVWWMAKIMAHRDYYWDKNDRKLKKYPYHQEPPKSDHKKGRPSKKLRKSKQENKEEDNKPLVPGETCFTEEEKYRFDQILSKWIDICPVIPIYEHTINHAIMDFLPQLGPGSPQLNTTEEAMEAKLNHMRELNHEAARKCFLQITNSSAISTTFLGMKYIEAMDNNHKKWDNNKLSGEHAKALWDEKTTLLPLCIVFGQLQGWRNPLTASKNSTSKYTNKPKDLQFITQEELQIINERFPNLMNPPEVDVERPPVPKESVPEESVPENKSATNEKTSGKRKGEKQNKQPKQLPSHPYFKRA